MGAGVNLFLKALERAAGKHEDLAKVTRTIRGVREAGEEFRDKLRNQALGLISGEADDYESGYDYESGGIRDMIRRVGAGRQRRLERRLDRVSDRQERRGGFGGVVAQKAAEVEDHAVDVAAKKTALKKGLRLWRNFTIVPYIDYADNASFSNAAFTTPVDMWVKGISYQGPNAIAISTFTIDDTALVSGGAVSASTWSGLNSNLGYYPFEMFLSKASIVVVSGQNISGGTVQASLSLVGFVCPGTDQLQ